MIKKVILWIAGAFADENRGNLSLSRLTFFGSVLAAQYSWTWMDREIPTYQFYFIVINLLYILFKDRSLALVEQIVSIFSKSPIVINKNVTKDEEKDG